MVAPTYSDKPSNAADAMADKADQAIRSAQQLANDKLDGLAGTVQNLRQQAAPVIQKVTDQANQMAGQVRDKARYYRDGAVDFVRDEPIKAVLIAAATGAALMALLSMMGRRDRG